MPSFLGALKSIGAAFKVMGPTLAPVVTILNPAAGAIFNGVLGAVSKAEQAYANVPKAGPAKAAMAVTDFEAGLQIASEVLAMKGEQLTYDRAKLQAFISAQVQALNALAELKASFQTTPIVTDQPPGTIEVAEASTTGGAKP